MKRNNRAKPFSRFRHNDNRPDYECILYLVSWSQVCLHQIVAVHCGITYLATLRNICMKSPFDKYPHATHHPPPFSGSGVSRNLRRLHRPSRAYINQPPCSFSSLIVLRTVLRSPAPMCSIILLIRQRRGGSSRDRVHAIPEPERLDGQRTYT